MAYINILSTITVDMSHLNEPTDTAVILDKIRQIVPKAYITYTEKRRDPAPQPHQNGGE